MEEEKPKLTVIDKRGTNPEKEVQLPTPAPPAEKKKLSEKLAEDSLKKQVKREEQGVVKCPVCHFKGGKSGFLYNAQFFFMVCSQCGVLFMEPSVRKKLLEKTVNQKQSNIIAPGQMVRR